MSRTFLKWTLQAAFAMVLATRLAHAGLFSDDEARQSIENLKINTEERLSRLENAQRSQVELANQVEALRSEVSILRGENEVLKHNLEAAQKRQQDFYIELDSRLRKLETSATATQQPPSDKTAATEQQPATPGPADKTVVADPPPKPVPSDPAREMREYEAALTQFKEGKFEDAVGSFEAFVTAYPNAALTPSAQYWLGNSYQAIHDCPKAIDANQVIISRWPNHARVPDAFLNIGACQQEQGDAAGAKKTLDGLIAKYPRSKAAESAKTMLP